MKILFIGLGSVGQRHLRNLNKLNYKFEVVTKSNFKEIQSMRNIGVFPKYRQIISEKKLEAFKPEAVFICNNSSKHFETMKKYIKNGTNIFVEKPLITNQKDLKSLQKYIQKFKSISTVGFQTRFNPCVQYVKKIIQNEKIIFSDFTWLTFLPDHRPWQNYKKSYVSIKKLGGGVINSLSHELDLISYFFGLPNKLLAFKNIQKLNLETEESITSILNYKNNFTVNLNLSLSCEYEKREFKILTKKKLVNCNLITNVVSIKNLINKKTVIKKFSIKRNDLFLLEIQDFIKCCMRNKNSKISIKEGLNSSIIAIALHDSIKNNKIIELNKY